MTAADLTELKRTLRQLLPDEGISAVIAALKKALPETSPKFSALFQLETRLNMANRDKIRGVLSQEQLELAYNRLSSDLMDLIDGLEEDDFSSTGATHKTGSILYKIPHTMQVNHDTRCVIRLAFEEDVIIRNIDLVEVEIKPIRVAEVMEVDLVDPNEVPAFTIRPLNSAEQFLEKGDFTEWVFFVKPMRTGELPLALRVSVLEVVAGKDRKKEIVLEETIHVVAEPDNDGFEETTTFQNAGYSVSYTAGSDAGEAETGDGSTIRRLSIALLIVFAFGAGAWALGLQQEISWLQALFSAAKPAFERYLEQYPDGRHREQALRHIDELDWADALHFDQENQYKIYLYLHPEGLFSADARHKLDSLAQLNPPRDSALQAPPGIMPPDSIPGDTETVIEKPPVRQAPTRPGSKKNTVKRKAQPLKPSPPAPVQTPVQTPVQAPAVPPADTSSKSDKRRRSGFEMVDVTGGTFTMGDAKGDKDECPHPVQVASFRIGRYEVTQADWREIMGNSPAFFKGCDECPVENVSWNDVQQFLLKASIIRGVRYQLPSEAEWEYAARGGSKSEGQTYAGGNRAGPVAWNHGNSERPNRVGVKRANQLGLYDMCGNVWEWCRDTFQPYPNCKGKSSNDRVLRGGSWRNYDDACRVSNRNQEKPGKREYVNGFRLVQER